MISKSNTLDASCDLHAREFSVFCLRFTLSPSCFPHKHFFAFYWPRFFLCPRSRAGPYISAKRSTWYTRSWCAFITTCTPLYEQFARVRCSFFIHPCTAPNGRNSQVVRRSSVPRRAGSLDEWFRFTTNTNGPFQWIFFYVKAGGRGY